MTADMIMVTTIIIITINIPGTTGTPATIAQGIIITIIAAGTQALFMVEDTRSSLDKLL